MVKKMINCNDTKFPIVVMETKDEQTLQDTEKMISFFNSIFERKESFVILNYNFDDNDKSEIALSINWFKENKALFHKYMKALAVVVNSENIKDKFQIIYERTAQVIYGCEGKVFTSTCEAEGWLVGVLSK